MITIGYSQDFLARLFYHSLNFVTLQVDGGRTRDRTRIYFAWRPLPWQHHKYLCSCILSWEYGGLFDINKHKKQCGSMLKHEYLGTPDCKNNALSANLASNSDNTTWLRVLGTSRSLKTWWVSISQCPWASNWKFTPMQTSLCKQFIPLLAYP